MIRYQDLQMLDYVLVDGKIRRVEAITKRKIGYHIKPDDQLHYARLQDVFPINIACIEYIDGGILVNGCIELTLNELCAIDDFHHTIKIRNNFGENLILREWHLHLLQHILRALNIKFEVKIEKSEENS